MQLSTPKDLSVNIVLIDDDDIDALGVARALKKAKANNTLFRARDGVEAISLLNQPEVISKPFLILLDLNMPRMNGIEFLDQIRSDSQLANSVVFIFSTSNEAQDKSAAYKRNVAGYIVKNSQHDGFYSVIDMLDHYWQIVELPECSV